MNWNAALAPVKNRGIPPRAFLDELVAWARTAPDEIFAPNDNAGDVFTQILQHRIGPCESFVHRKAALLELMRVLAGFESSWNWREGVDTSKTTPNNPDNEEAGAWQISFDSRALGDDLKTMLARFGIMSGNGFIIITKNRHAFAMEYAARLFRHTTHHNGPLARHEVDSWLSRAAVEEFRDALNEDHGPTPDAPIPQPSGFFASLGSRLRGLFSSAKLSSACAA